MQSACYKNKRKYSIIYKNKFVAVRTDPTTYLHFVTLFPVAALLTLAAASQLPATHTAQQQQTQVSVSTAGHHKPHPPQQNGYYGISPFSRNTVKGEILLSVTIRLPDLSWNCSTKHLLYKRTWLNMDS